MKLVPDAVARLGHRTLLKANAKSPTILVVSGVVGFGVTAVLVAKASRKQDQITSDHAKGRVEIKYAELHPNEERTQITRLYIHTTLELAKLYGPTLAVGTTSAVSILAGHRILNGRHVATMAAYSGLFQEFNAYRSRVAKTFGPEREREIYQGSHLEYVEDPDHKGEHKLMALRDPNFDSDSYLHVWFDESNPNWTRDPEANYFFLKGAQTHANNLLQHRGHVFLQDIYDALAIPRVPEAAVSGWLRDSANGDGFIDFGFMTGDDPVTTAFRNGAEKVVRLNFNIDPGSIWQNI